jgi:hypothetical protein
MIFSAGTTDSILSDGDAIFQPRKVDRAGLWRLFDGHVLIYKVTYPHGDLQVAHIGDLANYNLADFSR